MNLEQQKVLAHVVKDPEAWWLHAQAFGAEKWAEDLAEMRRLEDLVARGAEIDPRQLQKSRERAIVTGSERAHQALTAKVARWKPDYDIESVKPGYKNRALRHAEQEAAVELQLRRSAEAMEARKAQELVDIKALIAAEVMRITGKG